MTITNAVQNRSVLRAGSDRRVRDIVVTTAVCFFALCAAELALHLCGLRLDASLFQMDRDRNYSFRPGASGWHTAENDIFVTINNQGNRDQLRSLTPPSGGLRIAVLGSSTTAALEVEQQQTYTAQLEQLLSRPGKLVEVLNFAVEGYGPAQDYYTLQDQVWQFHPQIVMDEVSLKQYVLNSTKAYSTTSIPYPYFRVVDGHVVPDRGSQSAPRPTLEQIARTNHIRNIVNSIDLALLVTQVQKQLNATLKGMSFGSVFGTVKAAASEDARKDPWRWTLVPPKNAELEQGWQVCEGLMLAMREQAAAHGAEFWVIASDDAFQVNPNPLAAEKVRAGMHANDLDYGDNRFDQFLSTHDVNHIHLEPELVRYVRQTGAYLHGGPKMPPGEGHWNVLGHHVVAEIIANRLEHQSTRLKVWAAATPVGSSSQQSLSPTTGGHLQLLRTGGS